MADIVLINPKFEISFWGLEHALPFVGKRANMPVAALPLLAALTPAQHTVTIIDENVEPIDFDRCARADIVGVTGMSVQRHRMREILTELKRRGVFTVVGGPWITVKEDYFGELADVIFIGEAEETWPRFLADWAAGHAAKRYEQADKTDLSRVPAPRLDLIKMNRYAFGSVQFSRGCPFQCEFCDIIVTFGRRPRLKTAPQIIAELEGLRAQNQSFVFIVDDNLIGNKKAIKAVLHDVIAWQRANGYPLTLLHRGVARPGRRRRADGADGGGEHRRGVRRHREPQRGFAARDQEAAERAPAAAWSRRCTASRTPAWRSGAA